MASPLPGLSKLGGASASFGCIAPARLADGPAQAAPQDGASLSMTIRYTCTLLRTRAARARGCCDSGFALLQLREHRGVAEQR